MASGVAYNEQNAASHPLPTGIGRGEESGAVCICANATFAIYYSPCAQSAPSPTRVRTRMHPTRAFGALSNRGFLHLRGAIV